MMLPFYDILHCSQHTLTHASAVRHFLPLLLLTITLLIHTNTTAQPIADLFPSHLNHASFFCYPTLIPMIYYTTINYNLIPTTHAIYLVAYILGSKNHSIHLHYNYIEYNHALAVRDFLPLLLFAMTLLVHTKSNTQPITDVFPTHLNRANFLCYPILNPMIYRTKTLL